jgi:hypothetical protein
LLQVLLPALLLLLLLLLLPLLPLPLCGLGLRRGRGRAAATAPLHALRRVPSKWAARWEALADSGCARQRPLRVAASRRGVP